MEKIKDKISLPHADILFAPHHGRSSGKIPNDWMKQISPSIVVIGEAPSDQIDYLSGYNTITQNSAGDIMFQCTAGTVDVYVSKDSYSVNYLIDNKKADAYGGHYLGTLSV